MPEPYQVHKTPSAAFGVYFQAEDDPFEVFHDEEVARDFATVLNWAAADRERHKEMKAANLSPC